MVPAKEKWENVDKEESRVEYKPFGSKDIKATAKNGDKRDVTSIISFSTAAAFEPANLRSLVHYSTNFANADGRLLLISSQGNQRFEKMPNFFKKVA